MDLPPDTSPYILALAVLSPMIVAWINNRGKKEQRKEIQQQGKDLAEVREHVANTHTTNLRDDLDEMHKDIREFRSETRQDIGELRGEVREVRSQVRANQAQFMEFEAGVRTAMHSTHPEVIL